MKTFILALCVLLLIIIFVAVSSFHSVSVCKKLISLAEDMPDDISDTFVFTEALQKFRTEWESERSFIHFTVGHSENDSIRDALDELSARQKSGDLAGYLTVRARLISAIEKIMDAESLSFDTIF